MGRSVLQSQTPAFEVLILGAFLWIIWSGLRFADAQRVVLRSIVWDGSEVRGMCWRSKTCSQGHPFALKAGGFFSHGKFNWAFRFLTTLDDVLHRYQPSQWDFILPCVEPDGTVSRFEPMPYTLAMGHFRNFFLCPWQSGTSPMASQPLKNTTQHESYSFILGSSTGFLGDRQSTAPTGSPF